MESLDVPPRWAQTWCYYFALIAAVAVLAGCGALLVSNKLGFQATLLYLIAATVQAATAMTLFWMCRSSLGASSTGTCR
jgi:hypothetical protein